MKPLNKTQHKLLKSLLINKEPDRKLYKEVGEYTYIMCSSGYAMFKIKTELLDKSLVPEFFKDYGYKEIPKECINWIDNCNKEIDFEVEYIDIKLLGAYIKYLHNRYGVFTIKENCVTHAGRFKKWLELFKDKNSQIYWTKKSEGTNFGWLYFTLDEDMSAMIVPCRPTYFTKTTYEEIDDLIKEGVL